MRYEMDQERQDFEQFEPAAAAMAGAVDINPHNRPGVPQETRPPKPVANAHWETPEQQQGDATPLIGANMQLTPVYSTAIPPRGLSGAIRRAAYRVPDHRARRWMLLLAADRIDAIEHEPRSLLKVLGAIGAITLCVCAIREVGKHRRYHRHGVGGLLGLH